MINWNNFKTWLWSDAGAGWIIGLLSFLGLILKAIYDYFKRKRPNIVICREIDRLSLIRISKKIKENIALVYKKSEVKNLSQVKIEFYNSGSATIKDLKIQVCFDKSTKVLDIVTTKTSDVLGTRNTAGNIINFELPYLNAYNDHHSKVGIDIVCDGNIENFYIKGGGEGWSLEHKKLPSQKEVRLRTLIVLLLSVVIEPIIFLILNTVFKLQSRIFLFDLTFPIVDILFLGVFMFTYIFGLLWARRISFLEKPHFLKASFIL